MEKNLMGFIKAECANYKPDGSCLGVAPFNTGIFHKGKCLVAEKKPCPYFERAVLPIAQRGGGASPIYFQYEIIKSKASSDGRK